MGILSLLLWTPVIGALLLTLSSGQNIVFIRWISLGSASLTFSLAIYIAAIFDPTSTSAQFTEHFILNSTLGNAYALGVDGLSLPMLLLASLLTCIVLATSSSTVITRRIKSYHICILLLEFGMLGVFLTLDWGLFYVFWEATLIPLFFLIDRWGNQRRHAASLNFFLYTIGGSIFILVSLFAIGEYIPDMSGSLMSNFTKAAQSMPPDKQIWVLIGFLIGFSVKLPIFPLHGWLPLVYVETPYPISMLISGVILKMGAYGLLRVMPMLPSALLSMQDILCALALFSMLYGGLLAWRQSDLRAMLAYSSISYMGLVLLGITAGNLMGLNGAILQMTGHGLIAAALFLLIGILHQRTGTSNIHEYSSLAQVMPRFAVLTTVSLLATMGLPGTVSFVAQLHILIGGFEQWRSWMVLLSFSILVNAAYTIRTIGLLFSGPAKAPPSGLTDLNNREYLMTLILVTGIVIFGFFPAALIEISSVSISQLINAMSAKVG